MNALFNQRKGIQLLDRFWKISKVNTMLNQQLLKSSI